MNEPSLGKIFYLHIPKTGGQTLATRLASVFDPDKIHILQEELHFPKDVEKLSALVSEKDFIESHVGGAMLKDRHELDVLCTVREPVAQTLSNWRHIRREKSNAAHRASRMLRPGDFFDLFHDDFLNHQTRYLVSAFVQLKGLIEWLGYYRAVNENFQNSLARIRWLVPTDSIDDFVDLWTLETKRNVPNRKTSINVAPPEKEADLEEARAAILARPHLNAYDQLLYQIAVDRFEAYRREVFAMIAPWSYPDDSRRAYKSEGGGVWLVKNWYDPEFANGERAWYAGPSTISEVRVWRAKNELTLRFFVKAVNGIEYRSIIARTKETGRGLKIVRSADPAREGMHYAVSLEGLNEQDTVLLVTPHCYAPIMTRDDDPSVIRCSFLATDWRLEGIAAS